MLEKTVKRFQTSLYEEPIKLLISRFGYLILLYILFL